jgi:hypothetical protein
MALAHENSSFRALAKKTRQVSEACRVQASAARFCPHIFQSRQYPNRPSRNVIMLGPKRSTQETLTQINIYAHSMGSQDPSRRNPEYGFDLHGNYEKKEGTHQ